MTTPFQEGLKLSGEFDLAHIWHPFTQHRVWQEFGPPLVITRGEGVELIDSEGRRYLDGVSSLWCNVHGHAVPRIVNAIKRQADELCHSTLLGLTHQPLLDLTAKLLRYGPKSLTRIFYADSGTAAVEAALRIALEYWQKQPSTADHKRTELVSLLEGYHGDTLGSVSVGFIPVMHKALESHLVKSTMLPAPHYLRMNEGLSQDDALSEAIMRAEKLFQERGDRIAAFILEPLVQAAAGMWVYDPRYLQAVSRICREHGALLIIDEVATGFGKTGTMFACEQAGVEPDLMIIGKGLTGGYLPLSAVYTREELFQGFLGEPGEFKALCYGQTYAGNPLAAAAALANLEEFEEGAVLKQLAPKIKHFDSLIRAELEPLDCVFEVRRLGFMSAIELSQNKKTFSPFPGNTRTGWRVTYRARDFGILIRPVGNVITLVPPLATSKEQLEKLVMATKQALSEIL